MKTYQLLSLIFYFESLPFILICHFCYFYVVNVSQHSGRTYWHEDLDSQTSRSESINANHLKITVVLEHSWDVRTFIVSSKDIWRDVISQLRIRDVRKLTFIVKSVKNDVLNNDIDSSEFLKRIFYFKCFLFFIFLNDPAALCLHIEGQAPETSTSPSSHNAIGASPPVIPPDCWAPNALRHSEFRFSVDWLSPPSDSLPWLRGVETLPPRRHGKLLVERFYRLTGNNQMNPHESLIRGDVQNSAASKYKRRR